MGIKTGVIHDLLTKVDPEHYKGEWTFGRENFKSEDALHDFKTFCLIGRNVENVEKPVMHALEVAAWV